MLRKNVLLKQTNLDRKTKNYKETSFCSNSSFASNVDDYETAYEDSDVSAYYSFSENSDQTIGDENSPVKSKDESKKGEEPAETPSPGIKTVLGASLDHISYVEEETDKTAIEVFVSEKPENSVRLEESKEQNEILVTGSADIDTKPVEEVTEEIPDPKEVSVEAGEVFIEVEAEENVEEMEVMPAEPKKLEASEQNGENEVMETEDLVVIEGSARKEAPIDEENVLEPTESADSAEPTNSVVSDTVIDQKAECGPVEEPVEPIAIVESKFCPDPLPEITECDEEEPEEADGATKSVAGAEETKELSKTDQDSETRNNFIKKYRETIEPFPFIDEDKELAQGIALMSFPEEAPSEAINPFIVHSKKASPQPRKIVTRRSVYLSKIPAHEKRKSVVSAPVVQQQKRKIGNTSIIEEKPAVKRTRQSIVPRKPEPQKASTSKAAEKPPRKLHEDFSCKYCDRKFGIPSGLFNHQSNYCTKIPDKDRRQLLIDSYNKNAEKEMLPPPVKPRKSIIPPSNVMTRNQARLSIGQPVYSGITRTPSKTLTCTVCRQKFSEVLDFANHVIFHRNERTSEGN